MEPASKERYFALLRETWLETREFMLKKIRSIKAEDGFLAFLESNPVIEKRLSLENPKLRPFLLRLSFEACGGTDWKRVIPLCASVEFLNISTYISNAVLDEKAEDKIKKDINAFILLSMIFRELAIQCVSDLDLCLSSEEMNLLHQKISEINELVYLGQYLDLYVLKTENLDEFSIPELKNKYLDRADKFCGYFMGNICLIGAILANASSEERSILFDLGFSFGTGIQIANDLGDFALGAKGLDFEKTYKDLFSDLKHGKMTFPVLLAFECSLSNTVKELAGKRSLSRKEMDSVISFLITSGIVSQTKKLCLGKFRECKKTIRRLPNSSHRAFLSLIVSLLRSNKYFVFFREYAVTPQIP